MPQQQKKAQKRIYEEQNAIQDKQQRINIKSKRKRTLIRKAIEVSKLCNLEILIIIKDDETSKITEYNSGKFETTVFSMQRAIEAKNSGQYMQIQYNDVSYDNLLPSAYTKTLAAKELYDQIERDKSNNSLRNSLPLSQIEEARSNLKI